MSKPHDTVAHEWAHQSARNNRAKGFNMWYDGDTIYSYGTHFPIARHVDGVVLFTTASYGVSTSKHCTITRRACSHMTVFNVPLVKAEFPTDHEKNLAHYHAVMVTSLEQSRKRRKASYAAMDLDDARSACYEHARYAAHFKMNVNALEMPDLTEFNAALDIKIAEQRAETKRINDEKKAEQARLEALLWSDTIPAWRAGDNIRLPYWFNQKLLRIKGDNVETSAGAVFPVADMKRAWLILCRMRETGVIGISSAPVKFGAFRLDRVSDKGVTAGCHFVEWAEAERLAGELGL